ncbi:uncharacterized protein PG998_002172 [Apiospora kogelbergensis]|uniref:uncharacterized protein n=1 Tax=Apiospora kogelbergensis TaxID=1337665 RepID=UPI00312D69E4
MGLKFPSVSASAAASHVNHGLENRSMARAKLSQPALLHPSPSCDMRRGLMGSSTTSRKRLQPRRQTTPGHKAATQPPWQPCRKCGKSYVQLPTELCNECDKKLYCTAPPLKIRLDDKRPLLQAEPLVFPAAPPPPPQKLNGSSTKLEKRAGAAAAKAIVKSSNSKYCAATTTATIATVAAVVAAADLPNRAADTGPPGQLRAARGARRRGPLSAERQRVLAQELSHARAELECSRRAVRNLNEEMARMAVRTFRADDRRRRLRRGQPPGAGACWQHEDTDDGGDDSRRGRSHGRAAEAAVATATARGRP